MDAYPQISRTSSQQQTMLIHHGALYLIARMCNFLLHGSCHLTKHVWELVDGPTL